MPLLSGPFPASLTNALSTQPSHQAARPGFSTSPSLYLTATARDQRPTRPEVRQSLGHPRPHSPRPQALRPLRQCDEQAHDNVKKSTPRCNKSHSLLEHCRLALCTAAKSIDSPFEILHRSADVYSCKDSPSAGLMLTLTRPAQAISLSIRCSLVFALKSAHMNLRSPSQRMAFSYVHAIKGVLVLCRTRESEDTRTAG